MTELRIRDQLALGFMTFALFLGAGNIIFPPSAGLAAGERLWPAALGFLITAVGLPLLTVVALARVGGGMDRLTSPLGQRLGQGFAVIVYLAIGPLFAAPRTAVVSFELGVVPFAGNADGLLAGYSLVYFAIVLFLALKPGKLIDRIGRFITPALLLGLLILGGAALLMPAGEPGAPSGAFRDSPLLTGFVQGYLTMDTLGALVFGIVIVTAIRDRGVESPRLVTRYTIGAGLVAAFGLSLVYLALFHLGAGSGALAQDPENGGQLLAAYAGHVFGWPGNLLLALIITLACLTTAVGLTTACGEYFARLLPLSYRTLVVGTVLFSLVVANQGLTQLIKVSVPVLVTLYPLAIMVVVLNLLDRCWRQPRRVYLPVLAVTLLLGLGDGLRAAGWEVGGLDWSARLPLAEQSMGWLLPALVTLALAALFDRLSARPDA